MQETKSPEENNRREHSRLSRSMSNFKQSKIYKVYQFLVSSAAVSFLVSVVVFVYGQIQDAQSTAELVDNLQDLSDDLLDVQNSVSTRYLGIFPDYLTEVNGLLSERTPKDTVVIFEDVLYYGVLSKPESFIRMNHMLLSHADGGGKITIAYYGVAGRTFHRMIREQRINPAFFGELDREMDSLRRIERRHFSDSALCEKYFSKTRELDPAAFARNVDKYLAPLSGKVEFDDKIGDELERMYARMDSVKTHYLNKPKDKVRFSDYENMYKGMSKLLIEEYESHGIELIPMDEYLVMSCWLVANKAVLAFPSKYATDEIGFYSQDPAFGKYIKTMLKGVKGYYRK